MTSEIECIAFKFATSMYIFLMLFSCTLNDKTTIFQNIFFSLSTPTKKMTLFSAVLTLKVVQITVVENLPSIVCLIHLNNF